MGGRRLAPRGSGRARKPGDVAIEVMDDRMAEILRKKSHAERLAIGFGLWRSARIILTGSLKSLHPDWSDDKVQKEVARRLSHGAV